MNPPNSFTEQQCDTVNEFEVINTYRAIQRISDEDPTIARNLRALVAKEFDRSHTSLDYDTELKRILSEHTDNVLQVMSNNIDDFLDNVKKRMLKSIKERIERNDIKNFSLSIQLYPVRKAISSSFPLKD